MNSSELKELLRATTAFSILSDRELDHLANRFELIHFSLGQDVVRASDGGNHKCTEDRGLLIISLVPYVIVRVLPD